MNANSIAAFRLFNNDAVKDAISPMVAIEAMRYAKL